MSFSEVKFLNTHRDRPEDKILDGKRREGRRKTKALDDEEELSRFFAAKEPPQHNVSRISHRADQKPRDHRPSRNHHRIPSSAISSVTLAELPGRPFLGFDRRGPSSGSPKQQISVSPPAPSAHVQQGRRNSCSTLSRVSWSESPRTQRSKPRVHENLPPKEHAEPSENVQNVLKRRQEEIRNDSESDQAIDPSAQQAQSSISESLSREVMEPDSIAHGKMPSNVGATSQEAEVANQDTAFCSATIFGEENDSTKERRGSDLVVSKNHTDFRYELDALLHKWKDKILVQDDAPKPISSLTSPVDEVQKGDYDVSIGHKKSTDKPEKDASLAQTHEVPRPDVVADETAVPPVIGSGLHAKAACSPLPPDSHAESAPGNNLHRPSLAISPLPSTQIHEHRYGNTEFPLYPILSDLTPSYSCNTPTTWAEDEPLYERQIQTQYSHSTTNRASSRGTALGSSPRLLGRRPSHICHSSRTWPISSHTIGFQPPVRDAWDEHLAWPTRRTNTSNPEEIRSGHLTDFHAVDESPMMPASSAAGHGRLRQHGAVGAAAFRTPRCAESPRPGNGNSFGHREALGEVDGNALDSNSFVDLEIWEDADAARWWHARPELHSRAATWSRPAGNGGSGVGDDDASPEGDEDAMVGFWRANVLY